jgi:gliding motility-associated-like protein
VFGAFAQKTNKIAQNMDVVKPAISFVENKNQWYKDIRYRAEIPAGFLDIQNGALQYFFYDVMALNSHHHDEHKPSEPKEKQPITYHSFVINFEGANPVQAKASEQSPTKYNYYLGNDRNYWADEASAYHRIAFENIYNQINYYLYSKGTSLKYEFHLEAGADPSQIKMNYNHTNGLELLPDGNLEIKTAVGSIYEKRPYSYQIIKGKVVSVPTTFILNGKQLSFGFPKGYNKKYPLVIDPDLIFSTYSGSTSSNYGNTATFDNDGNLYSGSTSFGTSLRTGSPTPNNYGTLTGTNNIRLYKYNPTGTVLLYVTFIGGNDYEIPHSIVVDGSQLIVFGATGNNTSTVPSDNGFPRTLGTIFQGGTKAEINVFSTEYPNGTDLYVVKLNANGTLNKSRLLGGAGNEAIKDDSTDGILDLEWTINNYGDGSRGDVYVDSNGDILIATNTTSTSIAGVTGTLNGAQDGLLLKFDTNLNLVFGRYFGGNKEDMGLSVKTDATGNIFVGGGTRSSNLPSTAGSLNPNAFGNDDGFIAKFDNNGNLIKSTYLGTANADIAFFIDLDAQGNVYAYGQAQGRNYPIFPAVNPPYSNAGTGQFIHKMNNDLTITEWSTRVGSTAGSFSPTAFLVDNCGNIFISGWGGSYGVALLNNVPVTSNAYKGTTDGRDFYLAVFKPNMTGLLYGTFIGGSTSGEHVDGGTSRFSKEGIVYHAVCTDPGFSTTAGAWATTSSAGWDCAVFKFETSINANFQMQDPILGTPIVSGGTACFQTVKFKFPSNVTEYETFKWDLLDIAGNVLFTESVNKDFEYTFTTSGDYKIQLVVTNCAKAAQSIQNLVISLPNFIVSGDAQICRFGTTQLLATGAKSYKWTPTTGLSNPNIGNPIASPNQTTTYTVEMKDDNCTIKKQVKVTVLPAATIDFKYEFAKECNTPYRVKLSLVNVDTTKLRNFRWNMGDSRTLQGANPPEFVYGENNKEFTITLLAQNENGCDSKVEKKIFVPAVPVFPPNAITPNGDGKNDTFEIAEKGYKLKIWNRWGKIILQSDDYKNDWGKDVPAGTYYYFLESPSGVNCNGWVQVMK